MADKLLEEVQSFLDDVVHDLTNLHVNVSQALNAPDGDAAKALGNLPAGLIDRAQSLSAQVAKVNESDEKAKPKAAAKK